MNLVSFGINDGEGVFVQFAGASYPVVLAGQQSVVRHLRLTFDEQVTAMDAGAVTLTPHPGVTVAAGNLQPSAIAPATQCHSLPGSGGKVWIVTFSGPGSDAISGVIAAGVYDVTLDPTKIKQGQNAMATAPPPFTFWTMFGGQAYTGTVVVARNLGADLDGHFAASVANSAPPYSAVVDGNLDGNIDGLDRTKADFVAGTIWSF